MRIFASGPEADERTLLRSQPISKTERTVFDVAQAAAILPLSNREL